MFKIKGAKFRTKLQIFFLLAIIVVLLASVYMYFSLQILIQDTTEMYEKNNGTNIYIQTIRIYTE